MSTTLCHLAQLTSIEATSAHHDGSLEPGGGWYTSTPHTIVGLSRISFSPSPTGWTLPPASLRLSLSSTPAWYLR